MVTMNELWEAQKREWPNSVQVSPQAMLNWASLDPKEYAQRMAAIAITIQFDKVLFYVTNPKGGYIGARYGVEGHEYMSGFSGCEKSRVVNSEIVE